MPVPPTPLHATDVFLSHSNRQESTCREKKSPAFPQEWCTKPGLHTADAKASPSASSSLRHMDLERLKSEACLAWSVHTTLDEERESQLFINSGKAFVSLKNAKKLHFTTSTRMCQALKASINNPSKFRESENGSNI